MWRAWSEDWRRWWCEVEQLSAAVSTSDPARQGPQWLLQRPDLRGWWTEVQLFLMFKVVLSGPFHDKITIMFIAKYIIIVMRNDLLWIDVTSVSFVPKNTVQMKQAWSLKTVASAISVVVLLSRALVQTGVSGSWRRWTGLDTLQESPSCAQTAVKRGSGWAHEFLGGSMSWIIGDCEWMVIQSVRSSCACFYCLLVTRTTVPQLLSCCEAGVIGRRYIYQGT